MKSMFDYMTTEQYDRYNEIISIAETNKANAPKPVRAPRAPMTAEQKMKAAENRLLAAQKKLDALLASQNGGNSGDIHPTEE